MGSLRNFFRKWFFKEPSFERFFVESELVPKEPCFEGSLRNLYRFFEELLKKMGSLKNPRLKGSLWNQKWCFKEPCFKGSLRYLYRLIEELLKEMFL